MRKKIYIYSIVVLVCTLLSSCKEEGADLRPGVYVDTDLIDAFRGKEISLSGQASCYTGLQSIAFTCKAWEINDVTDLSSQRPVVWNFDYSFVVPQDATFPQDLIVTATDIHGTEMKTAITMRYTPATTAPYIGGLQKQIAVDFDESTSTGECRLKATLYGEDMLRQAVVSIPDVGYDKTFKLSKREEEIVIAHTFTARGSYPMTITLTDNSDNVTEEEYKLIVMQPEKLDDIEDYPYMWVFKSNKNENDYIYGYYKYMARQDNYQYQVLVYAESDDTEFMFSPTMETNGARKFGESPVIEDRIISAQSLNNYVRGYKPGKGYWGLWIDINEKVIEKWALDNSEADKSPLYCAADWNSWTFTPMQAGETPYQQVLDLTIYKGNQYFAFATTTDWTHMWRAWKTDNGEAAGWWFSTDGSGDGASLPTINDDTNATISFDTAIQWCEIVKK